MPKSKKRKPKAKKSPQDPPQPPKQKWWSTPRKILAVFLAILGGSAAGATFFPRPTVQFAGTMIPGRSWPVSFRVQNDGLLPLENVGIFMGVCQIRADLGKGVLGYPLIIDRTGVPCGAPMMMTRPEWRGHTLREDGSFTIFTDRMIGYTGGLDIGSADIKILAKYEPWFIPLPREIAFRFTTYRSLDGSLHWQATTFD